ncbi:MAG: hypothetical protein J6K84_00050 [Oscillospiraceae bacterium]|nr:hypothetical protein [Oscillospiraceae bacterium]
MKKAVKLVSLVLAIIMAASLLAGCGGSDDYSYNDYAYRQKRLEWEARNPYNR